MKNDTFKSLTNKTMFYLILFAFFVTTPAVSALYPTCPNICICDSIDGMNRANCR